jgi:PAS domain-containing protein
MEATPHAEFALAAENERLRERIAALERDLAGAHGAQQENHGTEEVRRSEERLRLALAGTRQGIWDWDLGSNRLTWDDRCKEVFGLSADADVTFECRTLWSDGTMRWGARSRTCVL